MDITKGYIVKQALRRLAISGSMINPSPDDEASCLDLLDDVCTSLAAKGYPLGYKLPIEAGFSDASDDSGLADYMVKGISCALAVEYSSYAGLQLPQVIYEAREDGLNTIAAQTVAVQPKPYGLPLGSANGRRLFADDVNETIGDGVTILQDFDNQPIN